MVRCVFAGNKLDARINKTLLVLIPKALVLSQFLNIGLSVYTMYFTK